MYVYKFFLQSLKRDRIDIHITLYKLWIYFHFINKSTTPVCCSNVDPQPTSSQVHNMHPLTTIRLHIAAHREARNITRKYIVIQQLFDKNSNAQSMRQFRQVCVTVLCSFVFHVCKNRITIAKLEKEKPPSENGVSTGQRLCTKLHQEKYWST